jgi:hypothetical protein
LAEWASGKTHFMEDDAPTDREKEFRRLLDELLRHLFLFITARFESMKIKLNKPSIDEISTLLKFAEELPDHEPDSDGLKMEEAKKTFDDRNDVETFWAGRILADRKSARIAA